jgi:hypothetical protein
MLGTIAAFDLRECAVQPPRAPWLREQDGRGPSAHRPWSSEKLQEGHGLDDRADDVTGRAGPGQCHAKVLRPSFASPSLRPSRRAACINLTVLAHSLCCLIRILKSGRPTFVDLPGTSHSDVGGSNQTRSSRPGALTPPHWHLSASPRGYGSSKAISMSASASWMRSAAPTRLR